MFKKGLNRAVKTAKTIYQNKEELKDILSKANTKAEDHSSEMDEGLRSNFLTLSLMLKHWLKGSFKISTKTIIYIIAGVLYFLNPLDLIPDFIFGLGFVDDAAVIALVIRRINKEIVRFKKTMEFNELEVVS